MVNAYRAQRAVFICFAALLTQAATAQEPEPVDPPVLPCPSVAPQAIAIDGLSFDWESIVEATPRAQFLVEGAYRYDWTGPVDGSFRAWCRQSGDALYLALVARDNAVVGPAGRDPGDTVEIRVAWGPERQTHLLVPVHDVEEGIADPSLGRDDTIGATGLGRVSPRESGFFLELQVGVPAIFEPAPVVVALRDVDHDTDREQVAVISYAPFEPDTPDGWATLAFGVSDAHLDGLLLERGRTRGDVTADRYVDVGGTAQRERVFVIEQELFVAGVGLGAYDWASADVAPGERASVLSLDAFDLDGDGDEEVAVRVRVHGYNSVLDAMVVHELVSIFDVRAEGLVRIVWQEVSRHAPDGQGYVTEPVVSASRTRPLVRFPRASASDDGEAGAGWAAASALDEGGPHPALPPWDDRVAVEWGRSAEGVWAPTVVAR